MNILDSLINEQDSLERQNDKLRKIAESLMRRVEQDTDESGAAYAQFQRAAMLEETVRARTQELERALDLLNDSNAKLALANAETEAARANLANAIETVQEGFALFDADEKLVMCNSRFGKHMRDIHPLLKPGLPFEDYVTLVANSPFLALPDGESAVEWREKRMARHKDNHVVFNARMAGSRWLQVSEHRTPDGGTVVLQTDVTDMVLIERQERERLLDDQARLIRATLDHLDQGVCIFDAQSRLAGWNRRVGELLSIPYGRFLVGTHFDMVLERIRESVEFEDDHSPEVIDRWVRATTRRAPLSFELSLSNDRILAVFAQAMPDDGFVISFTDVSAERAAVRAISNAKETLELRVMERTLELEDALSEAERANASKSRFVAAASHDLLQPLSAAKLYVTSVEVEHAHSPQGERLEKASNALLSVEQILGALLDISKLDSGQAAVHVSAVPLRVLLEQLSDEMRPIAHQKGLEMRVVCTDAVVLSDATYLRRILQNLMSNAVRYTESGRVLVGARRVRGGVRVEVWDTGPGIPENQQERVFDEFHRLNASASPANGMGLGLAIVERACRTLQHPLHLSSKLGQGTCFSIELPLAPEQLGAQTTVSTNDTQPRDGLEHLIILLIENDAELRDALTLTLEGWSADVLPCASLAEAEALLKEVDISPDVIVADYQLDDDLLGLDAVIALRKQHGPLPACIITANRTSSLADECDQAGVSMMHKPLDADLLRAFLSKAQRD
ncbi:sensor histidine kinase/response regulator [Actibacterium atlanticum]|uniref:histidine kinase n=1 Tax=Actibacterium atlanticum TaxID=1461693 RepID=A0A058ZP16_9RHOB|nr:sensor histidine kinase/response regulator [Actibacterium atlanticum]